MKKKLPVLILAVFSTAFSASAQKTEDKDYSFEYIRLPFNPLDKSLINYQAEVATSYDKEEVAKWDDYENRVKQAEQDYQRDLELYDLRVKEANERYEMELVAYNEKSTGKKIVEKSLLDDSKPQLVLPPKPVRRYVSKPDLRKDINSDLICSNYIRLDGFNKAEENAVRITVVLHGFENTQAGVQVNTKKSVSNGQSVVSETYYYSFEYRHPITVHIEVPGEGLVYSESYEEFGKYRLERTPEFTSRNELYQKHNLATMLEKAEERILDENMKAVNEQINSLFGYSIKERKTKVYNVVPKKHTYDEYQKAFELALFGYNNLKSDSESAKDKIKQAIELWTGALKESNPADKKSRINNDVTVITYLNLAEAYMWVGEYEKAEECLLKLTSLDPSRKEREHAEEMAVLLKEQKERFLAQ